MVYNTFVTILATQLELAVRTVFYNRQQGPHMDTMPATDDDLRQDFADMEGNYTNRGWLSSQ